MTIILSLLSNSVGGGFLECNITTTTTTTTTMNLPTTCCDSASRFPLFLPLSHPCVYSAEYLVLSPPYCFYLEFPQIPGRLWRLCAWKFQGEQEGNVGLTYLSFLLFYYGSGGLSEYSPACTSGRCRPFVWGTRCTQRGKLNLFVCKPTVLLVRYRCRNEETWCLSPLGRHMPCIYVYTL